MYSNYKYVVGLLLGVLFALAPLGVSHGVAQVRIGSLSAVTGPIPDLVAKIVGGERHAIDEINAAGGVLGQRVKLIIADSQCDAKSAVDAANKLVHIDQVTAIVGAICSGGTIGATQAVTIPAGIVTVSPSATSPDITKLDDDDLVYRTAPSDAYQGLALAKLARDLGYRRIALTYANDDYNTGLAQVFRKAFASNGGVIVADQLHEPNKPSYRSELATLARGNTDALVLFAYYDGGGIVILRQSLENGFFQKFLSADGMVNEKVIEEIGVRNLRNRVVFTAPSSDEDADAFKDFAAAHKASGGDPHSPYVAQGYDAAMLVALAIEYAGDTRRSKIARSLRAVASGPGIKVGPGEFSKAVRLIRSGRSINYEGASGSNDFGRQW